MQEIKKTGKKIANFFISFTAVWPIFYKSKLIYVHLFLKKDLFAFQSFVAISFLAEGGGGANWTQIMGDIVQ
jgi:hypothetical protein